MANSELFCTFFLDGHFFGVPVQQVQGIPKDFPVPIVVVQHMPPIFTRMLAERLASRSEIPVEEGSAGVILSPGHSWIALLPQGKRQKTSENRNR